jgi:imidazole glycerol-phosphate synthase subunit HisF
MLSKRIIPCLDVKDDKVVKGVRFREHQVLGDIVTLAKRYQGEGADELVFYDITASAENRTVSRDWVKRAARELDLPFCVAGGIRSVTDAREVLNAGADKVSVNSPALERPLLISELAKEFGSQCVVVGIDSQFEDSDYFVYQYTGSVDRMRAARRRTLDWIQEASELGAGEIVLNCMNQDGVGKGYDLHQLQRARAQLTIPLIASGGAGTIQHFIDVFQSTGVDGALAAGVFHREEINIDHLKEWLEKAGVGVRRIA